MGFPLCVTHCFSLAAFNILSLCLVFVSLINMSCCVSHWVYPEWDSLCLLDLIDYFLFHVGEIFNYNLFKMFLIPFPFPFFFWDPYNLNVGALIWSQRSLRLSSALLFLFTLFCSSEFISTTLSSSSLIHTSASDILLLIPSRIFLISVNVLFVSVCLFVNSSRALLVDSCIFSILFSRCLIIFTAIILNSFSGNFLISASFIWTSVSSLFLHLYSVSLPFLFFFF